MIDAPSQIWLEVEPLDIRAGIDGLSLRIRNTLRRSACEGSTACGSRNYRGNRIKLLVWDGNGAWWLGQR